MIIWDFHTEFIESLHKYNNDLDNKIKEQIRKVENTKEPIKGLINCGLDDGEFDEDIVLLLLIVPINITLNCTNDRPYFPINTKHLSKEYRLSTDQVYALLKKLPENYRRMIRKEFVCPTKYDKVLDNGIITLDFQQFESAAEENDLSTEFTIIGYLDAIAEEYAKGDGKKQEIFEDLLTLRHVSGIEIKKCFNTLSSCNDNDLWVKKFLEIYHSHLHYFTSHERNILDGIFHDELASHYVKTHKLETATQSTISCDSSYVSKGKKAYDLINELIGNWIDSCTAQNHNNNFVMSFYQKILIDSIENSLSKQIVDALLGESSKYRYRELNIMVFCHELGFLIYNKVLNSGPTEIARKIQHSISPSDSDCEKTTNTIRSYIQKGIANCEIVGYNYINQIIANMSMA